MFCKNCGSSLRDGSTFCHNCGTPVNNCAANNVAAFTPEMSEQNTQNVSSIPTAYNVPPEAARSAHTEPQQIYPPQAPVNSPVPPSYAQSPYPPYPQGMQNPQMPVHQYPPFYPMQSEAPKKSSNVFSILSLVFGILSMQIMFFSFIFSPLAIIFGIIDRKKEKSAMAVIGIILGSIALAILILYIVISLVWFSSPDALSFFEEGLYF